MTDPITLTLVGGMVLKEGVKFLYGQAGELLKRWRERRDASDGVPAKSTEPASITLPPEVFEGRIENPLIHFDNLAAAEQQIRELRRDMALYVDEGEPLEAGNQNLMQRVDLLRQLLEAVYQQQITFKGEKRPSSGPVVGAKIDVEQVLGRVAGVRSKNIKSGNVDVEIKAKTVGPGGEITGVDADTIGN